MSLTLHSVLLVVVIQLCSANLVITADEQQTSDITCWTCPIKKNNDACNDWAPDVKCPLNNTVCKTTHVLDKTTGQSVSVIKQCAPPSDCDPDTVGCTAVPNTDHMVCVSCCDKPYCNVAVPVNTTTAIKLSSFFSGANGLHLNLHVLTFTLVVVILSSVLNGQG
ncbi:ly6/PLAUR domain-containing protein 6-like [Mizuhopecten yessoensis]|uniref:Ly6/PLAUR domain-containing protein 6 n=1 Tax=Mizuhopecten yessoensis TaxID=6573 RepID=A0A210Q4R4_MIZYE|nr:ly6/PLAUR domain-containing protein 6-like [Mizuhopecten yessoensis]XP_021367192.1 ly6/PLAUR domain-containing protein 6-like [Mizuhopecten yessoensis]XP_021367193.1 ly6/PLAUR domain-containing protein 6-like [Mizuhopecten yessoensis]XP_021367194.1 ly6/PLAUR domain-containing protein 6-like [Mizuhopecten yessoensis]OWF43733.1 Ly6/PLAUR domain-containing protein 6 [Mizuhopecten yessoensis]